MYDVDSISDIKTFSRMRLSKVENSSYFIKCGSSIFLYDTLQNFMKFCQYLLPSHINNKCDFNNILTTGSAEFLPRHLLL